MGCNINKAIEVRNTKPGKNFTFIRISWNPVHCQIGSKRKVKSFHVLRFEYDRIVQ